MQSFRITIEKQTKDKWEVTNRFLVGDAMMFPEEGSGLAIKIRGSYLSIICESSP